MVMIKKERGYPILYYIHSIKTLIMSYAGVTKCLTFIDYNNIIYVLKFSKTTPPSYLSFNY